MKSLYAHLRLWDPDGQAKLSEGRGYGGEAQFFVLAADRLDEGIIRLLGAIEGKGLELNAIPHAGWVEDFEQEHFPFPVDLDLMAKDSLESGKICAMPARTFSPYDAGERKNVMIGWVEFFDPGRKERPYAGEISLVAVSGAPGQSLRQLLNVMREDALRLISLENVADASTFDDGDYDLQIPPSVLEKEAAASGQPVFGEAFCYGSADDN